MKKKVIIAIVSLIVFGQGAWAEDVEWPTTIGSMTLNNEKYYPVSSVDNLNDLAVYVNGQGTYSTGDEETTSHTCAGLTFMVTDNITFTAPVSPETSNFTPIGSCEHETDFEVGSFQGTFDGGNNTISGIRVYQPTRTYVGLFGNSNGATIKNVRLSNCQFTGLATVGGIVAAETKGTPIGIDNCHVDDKVVVTAVGEGEFDGFVGGIAGMYQYATISNCSSLAKVTGSQYVGGVVGLLTTNPNIGGNVSGCSSNGVMVGRVNVDETAYDCIVLVDDANNSDESGVISTYNNKTEDVVLLGRTLYRDGGWNTICLPFNVSAEQMAATTHPLYGATIKQLDTTTLADFGVDGNHKSGIEDGCLYLNFAEATSIVAGVPYIIKWGTASVHPGTNITNPVFTNVTIINADVSTDFGFTGGSFKGTYNAITFTAGDQYLLMGGANTLYYPGTGAGVGACRAYFYVPGTNSSIKMFNLNFSDYSTTTKITNTNLTNQTYEDGEWWTLSGMKLSGKPSQKGVYLFNGKKVVIQ